MYKYWLYIILQCNVLQWISTYSMVSFQLDMYGNLSNYHRPMVSVRKCNVENHKLGALKYFIELNTNLNYLLEWTEFVLEAGREPVGVAGFDVTGDAPLESLGVGETTCCGVAVLEPCGVGGLDPCGVAWCKPTGVATFDPVGVASRWCCGVAALEPCGVACFDPVAVFSLFSCGVAGLELRGVACFEPCGVAVLEPFGVGGLDVCGVAFLDACWESMGLPGLEVTGAVSPFTGVPGFDVFGVPGWLVGSFWLATEEDLDPKTITNESQMNFDFTCRANKCT